MLSIRGRMPSHFHHVFLLFVDPLSDSGLSCLSFVVLVDLEAD